MSIDVYMGRKFNIHHQMAIILTRHLGAAQALDICQRNGWTAIGAAIREQEAIVTRPLD